MTNEFERLYHEGHQSPMAVYNELVTGCYRQVQSYHAYRSRGTEDWLMIQTLDGEGVFRNEDGTETQVKAGDIAMVLPGTRHDYGIAYKAAIWELIWAHFHPHPLWHEWMRWPEAAPGLMVLSLEDLETRKTVTDCFQRCHALAMGSLPFHEQFAMNALEQVLLWCATQIPVTNAAEPDARVRVARTYIQDHLREKLSVDAIASDAGVSTSRLTQLFRQETGMTPIAFLEFQRLTRAKQLLTRTTLSIGMIAEETGFENAFYFTQRFKKHTGLTPTDFRRQTADMGERD